MKQRLLDNNIKVSPQLAAVVERTFKCALCLSAPMQRPGFQTCCQSLVGCYTCLDDYYHAERDKPCPKCRAPRGNRQLFELLGLDELLGGLQHIGNENQDDDDDTLPDLN